MKFIQNYLQRKKNIRHIDLHINTLTKELVQEIKDFLKKIFVCLIRIYQSDYHRWTLEPTEIYVKIHHMFFYNSKLDHPDYESHYPMNGVIYKCKFCLF